MNRVVHVVVREVREALPAMLFFLVLFHLIAVTKAVVLEDYSITALRAATSTIAALLVAKAILIIEALPVGRRFDGCFWPAVVWKTALFALVTLLFRFLEEYLPLLWHHLAPGAAAERLVEEIHWPTFWVVALWILWGLFLYTLIMELMKRAPAAVAGREVG